MGKIKIVFVIILLWFSAIAQAEVRWSGYGSLIGGMTMGSDERFTADWYDVGQYVDEFEMESESLVALQASTDLTDKITLTMQLVAKGADEWEPDLDWFYINYQATDNLLLSAGRRNIPMYYYSEFVEVGYAYPWMRPPSNLYWWQITQFNSIQATYSFSTDAFDHAVTLFYGNENYSDNPLLNFYFDPGTGDENWKNITGINWNVSGSWFDIRFVYFTHDQEQAGYFADGSLWYSFDNGAQDFLGLGGSMVWDDFTFLFDYNYVTRDDDFDTAYPTYLLSLVYRIGEFQPYIVYSKADQERDQDPGRLAEQGLDDYEEHTNIGIGLRYDFAANMAFKIQYDVFEEEGYSPAGWDIHGDSETLTFGVDFVF